VTARPAHAHAREERICAREGCHEPMQWRRKGALYCSGACRTAAYRSNARATAEAASVTSHIEVSALATAFWDGYRCIRRPDLRTTWPREGRQRAAGEGRETRT
jgi:hypothetical protein